MVVAIPPALVVERDDEQVLALEGLEQRLTVGASGQGVAETAGQLVQHGGLEQERADLVRLPLQHLLDEVVEDEPMASGEGLDEPGDVAGMGAGRQRGQLQPRARCTSRRRGRGGRSLVPSTDRLIEAEFDRRPRIINRSDCSTGERGSVAGLLRSVLVLRVLGCLRDHPHDNTAARVARRLGTVDVGVVEAALVTLDGDGLAMHADGHWSLTRRGWTAARADEPPGADDE